MMVYLWIPFLLQSLLMFIDERIHVRRGLGTWERLGHPLDTLTVFVPLSLAATREYTPDRFLSFVVFGAFSCIFITKDEWIHAKECDDVEHWLHSLLFILHPLVFVCTAILWKESPDSALLVIQPVLTGIFMVYQIFKWSLSWKEALR